MTRGTPPQHGERRCYLRGCRRDECLHAHYQYMSLLRLDTHRGQARRTNAKHVTQHLHDLIDLGWTQAQIERATGVTHRTLGSIIRADFLTVGTDNARRILALPVGPPPDDTQDVDATGTIRRLRALIAIGHTYVSLAPHIGIHKDPLGRIARGERPQVRSATAEATTKAYRQLSRTPGTSTKSRLLASKNGWHGPLAWDEFTIDNPNAEPEVDEGYTPIAAKARDPLRRQDMEHLARFGASATEIAKRTGASKSYAAEVVADIHAGQKRNRKQVAA